MVILICWKPQQLTEDDHTWMSDCSDILHQHPQMIDQRFGIQVKDVVLTNVQEHNGWTTSQSWLELAVNPSIIVSESHGGTTSAELYPGMENPDYVAAAHSIPADVARTSGQ